MSQTSSNTCRWSMHVSVETMLGFIRIVFMNFVILFETVARMNPDMFGLCWLQVTSFVFAHDLSPCVTYDRLLSSAAWWMLLVQQDLIYHLELLWPTPVLMGSLLLNLYFSNEDHSLPYTYWLSNCHST